MSSFLPGVIDAADQSIFTAIVSLVVGVVIGVLIVTVLVMHRRWVSPVRMISKVATRLGDGAWNTRADVDEGSHDVRVLGEQLNRLAIRAQDQFRALGEQRASLQLLVDSLPDPILLAGADDKIILVNAPAARLLGVETPQLIGRPIHTAVSDASILDLYESLDRKKKKPVETNHQPVHREIKLVRNGQRLSFQAMAQRTDAGGILIVLRDVSTLAGAIQMKTDFVANASHELRTPISAIKVAFETLRDVHHDDPALTERCITIIDGHLRRLEEMLRDLLDLSRVESADLKPHLAPVRSADLFSAVRSVWQGVAREKQVELVIPPGDSDLTFVSDRRLLELVLKNLVENAIKFTPPGGRVTLGITRRSLPEKAAAMQKQLTGGEFSEIVLSVTDTGCGIPPEHLDRVFERFYQVDPARSSAAGRGTGLGLAIVKHAVHALSGTVKLSSEVGKGTTVFCTLPQSGLLLEDEADDDETAAA